MGLKRRFWQCDCNLVTHYSFTVPAGVRSINIHCTGGGGGGSCFYNTNSDSIYTGGDGGGGGYTSYRNGISVSPGQTVICTIGAGGVGGINNTYSSRPTIYIRPEETAGETTSAVVNGITITAFGGNRTSSGTFYDQLNTAGSYGGSGGGERSQTGHGRTFGATVGSSDGRNSTTTRGGSNVGKGQGSTTKEFGTGVLYSGGGGGGGSAIYVSGSESNIQLSGVPGGDGGGGHGGGVDEGYTGKYQHYSATEGVAGSFGTGGGGGGGSQDTNAAIYGRSGQGGSGNVIITW